jgi:hypothetical protein
MPRPKIVALVAAAMLFAAVPGHAAQRAAPRGGGSARGGGGSGSSGGDRHPVGGHTAREGSAPQGTARPRGETAPAPQAASAPPPTSGQSSVGDHDEPIGRAVPRRSQPIGRGSTTIFVPSGYYGGFYPWGYGGIGFGYYGYGPFSDPWLYGGVYRGGYANGFDGRLRLKVKPREAEVYVDGYYAGRVDDFDGVFQRLHLEAGPHRIEIRAEGYETLFFDVRILPDETTTYTGELKSVP